MLAGDGVCVGGYQRQETPVASICSVFLYPDFFTLRASISALGSSPPKAQGAGDRLLCCGPPRVPRAASRPSALPPPAPAATAPGSVTAAGLHRTLFQSLDIHLCHRRYLDYYGSGEEGYGTKQRAAVPCWHFCHLSHK